MDQRPWVDLVGQGLKDGQVSPLGRGHLIFRPGIGGRRERRPVERKFRAILLVEEVLLPLARNRHFKKPVLKTFVRRKVEGE